MNGNPIIEPERHGVWIVAAFIVALLGLALAAIGVYRINVVTGGIQAEVVFLNNKIEKMRAELSKSAAPAQPQAAPAAPAPAAPTK